jgi:hypothetical protein
LLIEHYWPQVQDAWDLPMDDFRQRLAMLAEIDARRRGDWYDPLVQASIVTGRRLTYIERAKRGNWHG